MTYLPYIPKIIGYINPNGDSKIVVPSASCNNPVTQYYTNPPTIGSNPTIIPKNNNYATDNGSGFALNLFSNNNSASSNANSNTNTNTNTNTDASNFTSTNSEYEQNANNNGVFANGLGSYSNSGIEGDVNSNNNGGLQSNDPQLSSPNGINTRVNRGQNQPVSGTMQGSNEAPSNMNYYGAIPSKEGNFVPMTTDFGAFGK
jgi:hypothetical protein